MARSVEIEHFAAGTVILEQSGEPARHLYVVRKGAVELIAEGRLYDLLSEGEVFGQFSLLTEESPTSTVRAHEDTLCYLIGPDVADEVLGTSAGQLFVLGRMRERLEAGFESLEPPGLPFRPVGGLIRRAPVTADPGMSVEGAAERMTAERVSSLLVAMRDGWGIVTDRDLRSRVLASHREPRDPPRGDRDVPGEDAPREGAGRRGAARDVRRRRAPLPGDATGRIHRRRHHGHRPDGHRSRYPVLDPQRDRARADARRGRGRGPGAPAGGPRPGRRQLRAGRRRPRRGARRGRDDHAAAHARDRALRRASGPVGVARPRERRAARTSARHRPGSRARPRRVRTRG